MSPPLEAENKPNSFNVTSLNNSKSVYQVIVSSVRVVVDFDFIAINLSNSVSKELSVGSTGESPVPIAMYPYLS